MEVEAVGPGVPVYEKFSEDGSFFCQVITLSSSVSVDVIGATERRCPLPFPEPLPGPVYPPRPRRPQHPLPRPRRPLHPLPSHLCLYCLKPRLPLLVILLQQLQSLLH